MLFYIRIPFLFLLQTSHNFFLEEMITPISMTALQNLGTMYAF